MSGKKRGRGDAGRAIFSPYTHRTGLRREPATLEGATRSSLYYQSIRATPKTPPRVPPSSGGAQRRSLWVRANREPADQKPNGPYPPPTPIGQAFAYSLNQWAALKRYVDDSALNIDNNTAEGAFQAKNDIPNS